MGDDGSFSTGELVSTMMAGPNPPCAPNRPTSMLLAEAKKFKLDGKTLTLSDANGNELARLHRRDRCFAGQLRLGAGRSRAPLR